MFRALCGGVGLCVMSACAELPEDRITLEVYSWWEEDSEQTAFRIIETEHERRSGSVTVVQAALPTAQLARQRLLGLMNAGAPPATFQANSGADLMRWTAVRYTNEQGEPVQVNRLRPLRTLFDEEGLWDDLPAPVIDSLSYGGEPFAVPINIHRVNQIYYSREIVEGYAAQGVDLLDLETWCPSGGELPSVKLPTIAIGTETSFSLVLLTFESVLISFAGADFYRDFWTGRAAVFGSSPDDRTADLRRTLECVARLGKHFNDDHPYRTWSGAVDLVANGVAAFVVMGDWARGRIGAELASGKIGSAVFSGSEGVFVFTSDSFPLPAQARNQAAALDLLRTIARPETQMQFSAVKGSVPARAQGAALLADAMERRRALELAEYQVPAMSGLFPPYYPEMELQTRLEELATNGRDSDIQAVLDLLRDSYPILQRWQQTMNEP